jgi:hypothetical protein
MKKESELIVAIREKRWNDAIRIVQELQSKSNMEKILNENTTKKCSK